MVSRRPEEDIDAESRTEDYRSDSLEQLHSRMRQCEACDLAHHRTQVVTGEGAENAAIMLIGEAPGADEDESGRPFVGRSGKVLDRLLAGAGIDRTEVFIANVVACRPPKNRNPRVGEIRAHAPWLEEQIRLVSPSLLVTLGRVPLIYFLPGSKVTRIRGVPQSVERTGGRIPLLPTFHPAVTFRRRETLQLLEEDFAAIPDLLSDI